MKKNNCKIKIISKQTLNEIPSTWSKEDYVNILDELGFSDEVAEDEIQEMTYMALSDQEPEESAEVVLKYRLSEQLSKGQIEQLSHEMQEDKASEEYPDIFLHHELFNVNQLLFKSFNGRFPNCKAVAINFDLELESTSLLENEKRKNEILLKALLPAMGSHSVIGRLYEEDIQGLKKFDDADGIVWKSEIKKLSATSFNITLFSSEYWLHDVPNTQKYETTFKIKETEEVIS